MLSDSETDQSVHVQVSLKQWAGHQSSSGTDWLNYAIRPLITTGDDAPWLFVVILMQHASWFIAVRNVSAN